MLFVVHSRDGGHVELLKKAQDDDSAEQVVSVGYCVQIQSFDEECNAALIRLVGGSVVSEMPCRKGKDRIEQKRIVFDLYY